jgi:hypothetical protein
MYDPELAKEGTMKTIWKFNLTLTDSQYIKMPKAAEILTIQRQNEQACLWALVNPNAEKETRYFEIHGTGNPILESDNRERKYIGTFQQPLFVWHVFERV